MSAFHIGGLAPVLAVLLQIHLSVNTPRNVAGDGLNARASVSHTEDSDEVSSSWFWHAPALTAIVICGVNQWIEDISLCCFFLQMIACVKRMVTPPYHRPMSSECDVLCLPYCLLSPG